MRRKKQKYPKFLSLTLATYLLFLGLRHGPLAEHLAFFDDLVVVQVFLGVVRVGLLVGGGPPPPPPLLPLRLRLTVLHHLRRVHAGTETALFTRNPLPTEADGLVIMDSLEYFILGYQLKGKPGCGLVWMYKCKRNVSITNAT